LSPKSLAEAIKKGAQITYLPEGYWPRKPHQEIVNRWGVYARIVAEDALWRPVQGLLKRGKPMSTSIESHPAAKIFPLSTGAEFAELVASMRDRGFDPAHAIALYEGRILDGRNRYRAALAAGVEPRFARWDGGNPFDFA
jgi:hypothetical protein